jgi:hypothetical protein
VGTTGYIYHSFFHTSADSRLSVTFRSIKLPPKSVLIVLSVAKLQSRWRATEALENDILRHSRVGRWFVADVRTEIHYLWKWYINRFLYAPRHLSTNHHDAVGIHLRQEDTDSQVVVVHAVYSVQTQIHNCEHWTGYSGFHGDLHPRGVNLILKYQALPRPLTDLKYPGDSGACFTTVTWASAFHQIEHGGRNDN